MVLSQPGIHLITELECVGKPFKPFVGLIFALALLLGLTRLLTMYNMKTELSWKRYLASIHSHSAYFVSEESRDMNVVNRSKSVVVRFMIISMFGWLVRRAKSHQDFSSLPRSHQ